MHEKYTTRGLVIYSSAYKEADKIISIYTEDFGLISAIAAGVRRSVSKLRYHTQDFSVRNFSLVRGRDIWRLVGAEEIKNVENISSSDLRQGMVRENLAVYARILSLMRRMIKGEEKNKPVFSTLFSLYGLLAKADKSDTSSPETLLEANTKQSPSIDTSALETLAVFRILHDLGYVKSDARTEPLVATADMNPYQVAAAKSLAPSLISAINKGLTESHL